MVAALMRVLYLPVGTPYLSAQELPPYPKRCLDTNARSLKIRCSRQFKRDKVRLPSLQLRSFNWKQQVKKTQLVASEVM